MKWILWGVVIIIVLVGAFFAFNSYIYNEKQADEVLNEEVGAFASEGDFTERYSARVDRVDVVFEHKNFTEYRLTTNGLVREGELNTERGFEDDPDATVYLLNWQRPEGEQMYYVRLTNEPKKLYVLDSNRERIMSGVLTLEE